MTDTAYQKHFSSSFKKYKSVISRSAKRIASLVDEVVRRPKTSASYWTKVSAVIDQEYNIMQRALQQWAKEALPGEYAAQIANAVEELAKAEKMIITAADVVASVEARTTTAAITSRLGREAVVDMAAAISSGKKFTKKLLKATQQTVLDESVMNSALGEAYRRGDIKEFADLLYSNRPETKAWFDMINEGKLVEVNGRHYQPDYYAELVARTKFHDVQSQATQATAEYVGSDLVQVSNHNTTTPLCMEHEGQVYSISGEHPDYPPLTDTPPFHPNCLHTLHVVFEWALKGGAA